MKTTLLNPYSVELKKHPFMEMRDEPVYKNGEYAIYHYTNQHFVHTFKNIVICERGAKNTDLIDRLVADIKPEGEAAIYHDYERPKAANKELRKALQGVIKVADRKTIEFDKAKKALNKLNQQS